MLSGCAGRAAAMAQGQIEQGGGQEPGSACGDRAKPGCHSCRAKAVGCSFLFFFFFFRKLMPLSRICERSSAEVQQKTAEAQS